jgi:magnesium chelatase subunit D
MVRRQGLVDALRGGILISAMAERTPLGLVAPLTRAIDEKRLCLLAMDESLPDEPQIQALLVDRLGLAIDLREEVGLWPIEEDLCRHPLLAGLSTRLMAAATLWPKVAIDRQALLALVEGAEQLGIASARPCLYAVRLAKVLAALAGRSEVEADDLAIAVRVALLPHASRLPASAAPEDNAMQSTEEDVANSPQPPSPPENEEDALTSPPEQTEEPSAIPDGAAERFVEAALAALPKHLLAQLAASSAASRSKAAGATGTGAEALKGRGRGRSVGARPRRKPRSGERLHLLASIRAAAPFQMLRRVSAESSGIGEPNRQAPGDRSHRLHLHPDDLHVHREKKRRGNTTIFVVDASGSMALQRLSEAKGAIEILLADCYVRRDRVAMIAFRGKGAEVLLDPTRSLVAAKRSLTALPGGGGSPVAAGLALAAQMVAQLKRMGDSTVVVVLTDGRANLTRDGQPGRQQAALEAQQMARLLAASADKRILIDTSMRPEPAAESIAAAMQGMYLAMPFAQAREMGKAVIAAQSKG